MIGWARSMKVLTQLSFTIYTLTIVALLMSGFGVPGSLSCLASTGQNALVGASCSAENTAAPTTWSWSERHAAVQTKKVFVLAAILFLLVVNTPRAAKREPKFYQWVRLVHPTLIRTGPIQSKIFLPYLMATHGW